MLRYIVFRIVAGLVLLAAIAGIGFFAYQAGTIHAVTGNVQVPAPVNGMPYYPFFWHPFFGVSILGLLFGLFLLSAAFIAFRVMIWGPRWGGRHPGHGSMGQRYWENGVPPMFSEWHRRMHSSQPDESTGDKKNED